MFIRKGNTKIVYVCLYNICINLTLFQSQLAGRSDVNVLDKEMCAFTSVQKLGASSTLCRSIISLQQLIGIIICM